MDHLIHSAAFLDVAWPAGEGNDERATLIERALAIVIGSVVRGKHDLRHVGDRTREHGIARSAIVALEDDERVVEHLLLFEGGNDTPDLFIHRRGAGSAWGAFLLWALVAGDHSARQILVMRVARKRHAREVEEDERKRDVGKYLVHLLYGLTRVLAEHAGKRPSLLLATIDDKTGHHCRGEEHEERVDHSGAARAVAEIALGAQGDQVAQISERLGRAVGKIREARVARPNKTPNHPRHDENARHIARPHMHDKRILGEVGDGKGQHQGPMGESYETVPHINVILVAGHIGIAHVTPLARCPR